MVEQRLDLEPEVQEIFSVIDKNQSFLLSGGAGSGKTYSLVQVIRQAIQENPTAKIACMTYTFAAVKEISDRINHKNLKVRTIHEFLWDNIKHFQREIKLALVELINDESVIRFRIEEILPITKDYFKDSKIQYSEFLRLSTGNISHDELLVIANLMFKKYQRLSDVLKDRFKFIFIDEYQDTSPLVVEILLKYLTNSKRKNIIGFFGDSMQAIYDDGIGNLNEYLGNTVNPITEIKKEQNRRNPKLIIDLANRLRTDGISQKPSNDKNAPNMEDGKIKEGNVKFIYSNTLTIEDIKVYLSKNDGWTFEELNEHNELKTKELNLTHNLIADKGGFRELMNIYDNDKIIAYKKRIGDYIKKNEIKDDFSKNTFEEVINILKSGKSGKALSAVLPIKGGMQDFIDTNPRLYNFALTQNFLDFSKIYVKKEQLLDDRRSDEKVTSGGTQRDKLIQHLFKIQHNIYLYQEGNYNEFIDKTDYPIKSILDKKKLKVNIDSLVNVGDKTIEDVIDEANSKGICSIDDRLEEFKLKKGYLYNRVMKVKFKEFQKLYSYLEGYTPFSTQHKTKGREFDNVLVVLDNGNWSNYSFEYLLNPNSLKELELNKTKNKSKIKSYPKILSRSQKIFYVCCTRAKENLVVFYKNPSNEVIQQAKEWFGEKNVIRL
jgi:DNA helicase-2/ATP-dependent DNA helicase PcrA